MGVDFGRFGPTKVWLLKIAYFLRNIFKTPILDSEINFGRFWLTKLDAGLLLWYLIYTPLPRYLNLSLPRSCKELRRFRCRTSYQANMSGLSLATLNVILRSPVNCSFAFFTLGFYQKGFDLLLSTLPSIEITDVSSHCWQVLFQSPPKSAVAFFTYTFSRVYSQI